MPPDGAKKEWEAIAETLFEFLVHPREWHELEEWRRKQKWSGTLLRNCLAWLNNRGLAYSWWKEPRVPIWARVGWEPAEEAIEEDLGDPLDDAIPLDDLDL